MKPNPHIDELLNGYLDGELTNRQKTEVERLIARDTQIAQRLSQFRKCKLLLGALPSASAPSDMVDRVKTALEHGYVPERPVIRTVPAKGRLLFVRNVVGAAAAVIIVAVLVGIIYTVLHSSYPQPGGMVARESDLPSNTSVESSAVPAAAPFTGRLELKANKPAAIQAFINRAVSDAGLSQCLSTSVSENITIFTVSCAAEDIRPLIADLATIWHKFDTTTLQIETDQFSRPIVIDAVTAEQTIDLIAERSGTQRIDLAKTYALNNSLTELMPGQRVLATASRDNLAPIVIPKPVLTSSRPAEPIQPPKDPARRATFTIVVTPSK